MKVFIGNTVSVLITLKLKSIIRLAIVCLEIHEFCNPYNLEII